MVIFELLKEKMKEERDLYDINRRLTGEKIFKGIKIPLNRYIITVTLFIQNDNKKILIQKRSKEKGGKYGFISGHPKTGQTSIEGIISETKEEIGIDINEKDIMLIYTTNNKNSFFDLYYTKINLNLTSLILQKKEVESVRWCSKDEIIELISGKEFFENHIDAFEIIKKYL